MLRAPLLQAVFSSLLAMPLAGAAELTVDLRDAPSDGRLVFQVYDDADAFGDFRDPALEVRLDARGDGRYVVRGVPEGDVALLVYVDANANGRLDKNFIGIPRETLGISNDYRPKGPPVFDRARFRMSSSVTTIDLALYRVLGARGRFGVGVGLIGRGSPYVGGDQEVLRAIPAITYVGERLQWFGPSLRYGLAGSGRLRLAVTANYRIGVYEENDSPALAGLGDREDTLLAGLGLQYELPNGFDLAVRYEVDALDRIGGSAATASVSRDIQLGIARLEPRLQANWQSSELAGHDFGVPAAAASAGRPAYRPGSIVSAEVGLGALVELSESWRIVLDLAAERLDDAVLDSPIVDERTILKGFGAITYVF